MRVRHLALPTFLAVAVVGQSAMATVYFGDNFNSQTANTNLVQNQSATGGTWYYWTGSGYNTADSYKVIADPTASGRGNVLHVTDASTSNYTLLYGRISSDVTVPIIVSYDFFLNSTGNSYPNDNSFQTAIQRYNGVPVSAKTNAQNLANTANDQFQNYNSSSAVTDHASINPDTWYTVTMTLPDPTSSATTYHLKLTSGATTLMDTDVPLFSSAAGAYREIYFRQGSGAITSDYYVDNVLITTVPEPAALGLLASAALLLRRRRA